MEDQPTVQRGRDGLFRVWVPVEGQWVGPFTTLAEANDERQALALRQQHSPRIAQRADLVARPPVVPPRESPPAGANPSLPFVYRGSDGFRVWHPALGAFLGPYSSQHEALDHSGAIARELRGMPASRAEPPAGRGSARLGTARAARRVMLRGPDGRFLGRS